jgi:hypothetical protein
LNLHDHSANDDGSARLSASERAASTVRIAELQEKLQIFEEKSVSPAYGLLFDGDSSRCAAQRDEVARFQLENGLLQEKITNEKRKSQMLQVRNTLK